MAPRMHEGRREFLLGLGSAIVTGAGVYGGYSWAQERGCVEEPAPVAMEMEMPEPVVEVVQVAPAIGAPWRREPELMLGAQGERVRDDSALMGAGELTVLVDRRAPFSAVRELLASRSEPMVGVVVERADGQRRRLRLHLDREAVPGLYAQDERLRAKATIVDPMPIPRSYLGVRVGQAQTRLERRWGDEVLAALEGARARGGEWSGVMWTLANRGAVSRLYDRTPWVFAGEDVRWEQVVAGLEALAPVGCQPHGGDSSCEGPWARLYVGAAQSAAATMG